MLKFANGQYCPSEQITPLTDKFDRVQTLPWQLKDKPPPEQIPPAIVPPLLLSSPPPPHEVSKVMITSMVANLIFFITFILMFLKVTKRVKDR